MIYTYTVSIYKLKRSTYKTCNCLFSHLLYGHCLANMSALYKSHMPDHLFSSKYFLVDFIQPSNLPLLV